MHICAKACNVLAFVHEQIKPILKARTPRIENIAPVHQSEPKSQGRMLTTYPMKHALKSHEIHIPTRIYQSEWKPSGNYGKCFKLFSPTYSILQYTP